MTDKEIAELKPIYKMYPNKKHSYSAVRDKEIYLTTPDKFNDVFDGCFIFDYYEFENKYLIKKYQKNEYYLNILLDSSPCYSKSALEKLYSHLQLVFLSNYLKGNPNEDFDIINLTESIREDEKKDKQEIEILYNSYLEILNQIRNSYYLTCFTKVKPESNIPMWYFYANNYNGFCCEFSFYLPHWELVNGKINPDNYDYNVCKRLYKVKYVKEYLKIDIAHLLTLNVEEVYNDKKINKAIKTALIQKNIKWKNEEEIRLLIKKEDVFFNNFHVNKIDNGLLIKFPFVKKISICDLNNQKRRYKIVKSIATKLKAELVVYNVKLGQVKLDDIEEFDFYNLLLEIEKLGFSQMHSNDFSQIPDIIPNVGLPF